MLRLCFVLLLFATPVTTALAQDANTPPVQSAGEAPKGPNLAELMKQQSYRDAWEAMLRGETVPLPDWIANYAKTLESPPVPSFNVAVGSEPYTMAFTCKPNECETNQLFVLFAPEGRHAWALLLSAGTPPRWLGNPDDDIKGAIHSGLE